MCLANGMKRPAPNIGPQRAALDDLVANVMPPMISRLAHVNPRAQVSGPREVSPQEGQLGRITTGLGRWSHDAATDTAPTLVGTQVHDEARLVVGHGQEHHGIHAVLGCRDTSCPKVLGSRREREIRRGGLLEGLCLRRSALTREPEGDEPIHPPAIAQVTG